MKALLVAVLLLTSTTALATCEYSIGDWCETNAINVRRNCADLVKKACTPPAVQSCIRKAKRDCTWIEAQEMQTKSLCEATVTTACVKSWESRPQAILNAARSCRRYTEHTGELCLMDAIARYAM